MVTVCQNTNSANPRHNIYDPDTLLLLHGDAFEDCSQYHWPILNQGVKPVTIENGGKFGKCFGTTDTVVDGEDLSVGFIAEEDLYPNSYNSFTVEWWEKPKGLAQAVLTAGSFFCTSNSLNIAASGSEPAGSHRCCINAQNIMAPGTGWNLIYNIDPSPLWRRDTTQWKHFAFVWRANITTFNVNFSAHMYINGQQIWQQENIPGIPSVDGHTWGGQPTARSPSRLFAYGWAGVAPKSGYNSRCCEIRISTVARYTSNFTPPTQPFSPYL